MINLALLVFSWLLVGPPLPFTLALEVVLIVGLISVLRNRLRQKSFALVGVMALMLIQCIVMVFIVHFQLWQPPHPPNFAMSAAWLFEALFRLDLPIAELGAIAAMLVGIYIEFGRSRLNLSQAFRNSTFSEPPNDLAKTVAKLANNAEIECPGLRLLESGTPSAFTVRTQRKRTIVMSIGLLESLDSNEVESCIAHEIGHIKNRDFALRSIVTIARIALFARLLSYLVETALYRTRELLADREAAILMGTTDPLISALTKLQQMEYAAENLTGSTVCCFDGKKACSELLSKHPYLSTRIRFLREMDRKTTEKSEAVSQPKLLRREVPKVA